MGKRKIFSGRKESTSKLLRIGAHGTFWEIGVVSFGGSVEREVAAW